MVGEIAHWLMVLGGIYFCFKLVDAVVSFVQFLLNLEQARLDLVKLQAKVDDLAAKITEIESRLKP